MRVRISPAARAELDRIAAHIGRDSQANAESFLTELLDRCLGLSAHAERYPVFLVYRGQDMRRAPYRRYLIFYSIAGDVVRIHHVVHSARDYLRLLFPED